MHEETVKTISLDWKNFREIPISNLKNNETTACPFCNSAEIWENKIDWYCRSCKLNFLKPVIRRKKSIGRPINFRLKPESPLIKSPLFL